MARRAQFDYDPLHLGPNAHQFMNSVMEIEWDFVLDDAPPEVHDEMEPLFARAAGATRDEWFAWWFYEYRERFRDEQLRQPEVTYMLRALYHYSRQFARRRFIAALPIDGTLLQFSMPEDVQDRIYALAVNDLMANYLPRLEQE